MGMRNLANVANVQNSHKVSQTTHPKSERITSAIAQIREITNIFITLPIE